MLFTAFQVLLYLAPMVAAVCLVATGKKAWSHGQASGSALALGGGMALIAMGVLLLGVVSFFLLILFAGTLLG